MQQNKTTHGEQHIKKINDLGLGRGRIWVREVKICITLIIEVLGTTSNFVAKAHASATSL